MKREAPIVSVTGNRDIRSIVVRPWQVWVEGDDPGDGRIGMQDASHRLG